MELKQLPAEIQLIDALTSVFQKSPDQLNERHGSDAELIQLGNGTVLACTADAIVEEIEFGLYDDPYLIGRMLVTVNLSDLAAVGATPIGLLLSQSLPTSLAQDYTMALQAGIAEACRAYNTFILGGDTSVGKQFHVGATAIGTVAADGVMSRLGMKSGDVLYTTAPLGSGSAYAFDKLLMAAANGIDYQPTARLKEGQLLGRFASACIDTSDGFWAALDELGRLNDVGFHLQQTLEAVLHPDALAMVQQNQLPAWMLLAGPHGEFELLFTVPEEKETAFLQAAEKENWKPLRIGRVSEGPMVQYEYKAQSYHIDTHLIRQSFEQSEGDLQKYMTKLKQLHHRFFL
ncbi:MAG: thiamine-phosphate kinase [Bacteroidota bacterium]